jgi:hypothetical protein
MNQQNFYRSLNQNTYDRNNYNNIYNNYIRKH